MNQNERKLSNEKNDYMKNTNDQLKNQLNKNEQKNLINTKSLSKILPTLFTNFFRMLNTNRVFAKAASGVDFLSLLLLQIWHLTFFGLGKLSAVSFQFWLFARTAEEVGCDNPA